VGAKARILFNRVLYLLAVPTGAFVVASLPLPALARLGIAAVVIAIVALVAFRLIPAFDPWGRVRWRLGGAAARDTGDKKICAITFDDGPSADTASVLDVLSAAGVRATFFVLAENARRHPQLLRRLASDGHTVAIHGDRHRKLHRASTAEVEAEVTRAISGLRALGVEPAPLYRTPHGVKNAAVFAVCRKLGLQLWAWSRGIWDTDRPDSEVLVARATRLARSGMVLLLHDGRGDEPTPDVSAMVAALPRIITRLRSAGFDFVTLDAA
jgi:peptidoglycan/xylan/chitin deacetylase (PgdA/CDA1 family)